MYPDRFQVASVYPLDLPEKFMIGGRNSQDQSPAEAFGDLRMLMFGEHDEAVPVYEACQIGPVSSHVMVAPCNCSYNV